MNLLKKISLSLIGIIIGLVLISYLLPSQWSVERSVIINASNIRVYSLISDLKKGWPQWSAFDSEDPTIKYTYSGPDSGMGQTREWVSEKMGYGKQTIIKADPNYGVEFKLFMPSNNFEFQGKIGFLNAKEGLKVTWADWGQTGNNPLYRWMCFFMDKMMGPAFERSLAKLKELSEEKK